MKFRTTIILITIVLLFVLVYNQFTNNITNLLTGNVAITSNTLNDEYPTDNSRDFNKINLSLILLMVVALFMIIQRIRYREKATTKIHQ